MSAKISKQGYFLAEACKNTFILFDCLAASSLAENFLHYVHECLVRENRDDAIILIDGKMAENTLCAKMLVLGFDGSLGEFCGNGARACAAFLFSRYSKYKNFSLLSKWGTHRLFDHGKGIYSIQLPHVRFDIAKTKFIANPSRFQKENDFFFISLYGKRFFYAEAIEPHLVFHDEVNDEELFIIGRQLNAEKELFPYGINVNVCKIIDDKTLHVKTYERGVQRLTLSCGTGSLACAALVSTKIGKVQITTPGGALEITLGEDSLELKGSAFFNDRKMLRTFFANHIY